MEAKQRMRYILATEHDLSYKTHEYIIEVWPLAEWRHAIGQAQVGAIDMNLRPAVYLFVCDNDSQGPTGAPEDSLASIRIYFNKINVVLLNDIYKPPGPFNSLPTEALVHLITITLTTDIRTLRCLAVNKRTQQLANTIWPQIARQALQFNINTFNLMDMCNRILISESRAYMTVYCAKLIVKRIYSTTLNQALVIVICNERLDIGTYNYVIRFSMIKGKYLPVHYYKIARGSSHVTRVNTFSLTPSDKSPQSILYDIALLVRRILPEIVDIFNFQVTD